MTETVETNNYRQWRNDKYIDTRFFYGSESTDDYMLRDQKSLPKYGYLARKAISHYLGEKYDPQTEYYFYEYLIREHIQAFIYFKIQHRLQQYDWEYIDHFLKKMIGDIYEIKIE